VCSRCISTTTHWNVMKEQPRQATDFYTLPVFFFPIDSLNTMKISFAIKFSRLRQRVHGTLREIRLVEREKCKREKKKKRVFWMRKKIKKNGADGWAQAVDFGWWSSRLNFLFFFLLPIQNVVFILLWLGRRVEMASSIYEAKARRNKQGDRPKRSLT
jgi:hypothetical protein